VEYFVWFQRGAPPLDEDALRTAIEEGPQLPIHSAAQTPPC